MDVRRIIARAGGKILILSHLFSPRSGHFTSAWVEFSAKSDGAQALLGSWSGALVSFD